MSKYLIGTAIVGSFLLGAGTTSILWADAPVPAYSVAAVNVKDVDGYTKDFLPGAQEHIKKFGGKYIAGGMNKAFGVVGTAPPNRVVIIQFPSLEVLKQYEDNFKTVDVPIGSKYAEFQVIGVEGIEMK